MEDYLDEKEKWEWLKTQLRENAPSVVAALVVVAAGVLGWRWWQGRLDATRLAAGAKYTQMIQALEQGDRTRTLTLLGELERDHSSSPYADQARLLAARAYVDGGELERAATELGTVAEHSKDRDLALVARLRLARVEIAQGKPDAALATLGGVEPGAFAARYHEARGDAYYAKGDRGAALREYTGAQVGGGADALLGLKIADLTPEAPAPTAPEAAKPTAAAKPPAARAGR